MGGITRRFAYAVPLGVALIAGTLFTAVPNASAAPADGALAFHECFRASDAACTPTISGGDLTYPLKAAVSPDGKSVYVSFDPPTATGLGFFSRDISTGALTQQANIAMGGVPFDAVVSPDNKFVFVTVMPNTVKVFDRDTSTGALTYSSCANPDGSSGCVASNGINAVGQLTISPDGHSLYVLADSVASFSIDATTGALTQIGCITNDG